MSTRKRTNRRRLGIVVAVVLAVTIAGLAFVAVSVQSTLDQVERADLLPDTDEPVALNLPDDVRIIDVQPDEDPVPVGPDQTVGIIVERLDEGDEAAAPELIQEPDESEMPAEMPAESSPELSAPEAVAEQGPVVQIIGEGEDVLIRRADPPPVVQPPVVENDSVDILFVGSDARGSDVALGRSDVIILAHISGDRQRVDLVHIPRDSYVNVPGYGHNKVNAAYAYGGTKLLVQSLQPLLGVRIDHVALTGFDGFAAGIDAVDGIQVNVTVPSPRFPAGPTDMDGPTALDYVRERKTLPLGDLSRGTRQQEVLRALMVKTTSGDILTNPSRLNGLLDALATHTVVDNGLTNSRIVSLATSLSGIRGSDIHSHTLPNKWTRTDPVAGSVVIVDEEGVAVLAKHLAADTMALYRR